MRIDRLLMCFLLASSWVFAEENTPTPNFAGTLLSTIPVNIAPHQWLVEPYLYVVKQKGLYNTHWNLSSQPQFLTIQNLWEFETGITDWLDITLDTLFYYSHSNSRNSYLYGDTQVSLGFQILRQEKETWIPNFRLLLQESFPTGTYDHLNPNKHRADASGSGAYETWFSSVLHKTLPPFTLNLSLNYILFSKTTVHGYSFYGGPGHATLRPGSQFIGNLGIEYALTQFWILGFDIHYFHQNASSHPTPLIGTPSLEQLSLAPCIEYNPSPHFGIEAGSWFTVAGRNSVAFVSAVTTIYWLF